MLRSAKYNNNNKMIENYLRELLMLCVPCRNEHPISENLGIFEEQYNSLNEMVAPNCPGMIIGRSSTT
jgi:hypothetical protein